MKKYIKAIFFLTFAMANAKESDTLQLGNQEYYIDYEKDKKWIAKVNNFKMGSTDLIKNKVVKTKDYFEYINNNSDISINYNDVMEGHISRYLSYKWLPRIFGLLDFYEPLFEAKLREYGLPTDLKYLAIVESNLNPQAGSWAGASGLWQFMPATGKAYGLAKNSHINLFYDPYSATDAAAKYLKNLYKMFGDWNLVLSAYNSGEGRVLGAIKKAGTKNYWAVRNHLPAETRAYAPSFHAVRYIGRAYNLYYKSKPHLKYNYTNIKEISVKEATTFKSIALQYGMNLETLYFLNPHIVTERIPPKTFVYILSK